MGRVLGWTLCMVLFAAGAEAAQLKVMVGVDPSDRESMLISVLDMQATLSKATGQTVQALRSQDLGDIMRSTRTGEYDVYIAPAHIATPINSFYDVGEIVRRMQPLQRQGLPNDVAEATAKMGENITVSRFARFKIGEHSD